MFRRTDDGRVQQLAGDPLALPRDRTTDCATEDDWMSLGLEQQSPRPPLGRQVTDGRRFLTRAGTPGRWRETRVLVQGRNLDELPLPSIGAGTIARNISGLSGAAGIASPGYFSWAANAPDLPPPGPVPAALEPPRVDNYYLSSLFLGLPDSDPSVVAGHERPQPGLAPFQSRPGLQAQPSTGWPVLAASIPSYASRIPLLRPRTLTSLAA